MSSNRSCQTRSETRRQSRAGVGATHRTDQCVLALPAGYIVVVIVYLLGNELDRAWLRSVSIDDVLR